MEMQENKENENLYDLDHLGRWYKTHFNFDLHSKDSQLIHSGKEHDPMNFDHDPINFNDKVQPDVEANFENEKQDIVKGFMIEKKIIHQNHEQDKQNLINKFIKEREIILKDFQKQLETIESRLFEASKTKHGQRNVVKKPSTVDSTENHDKLIGEQKLEQQTPKQNFEACEKQLFVRLDGSRVIRPEEFILNFEMEEKLESEKDSLERNFRKEKERIKDILELEYERKFLREKLAHESEIKNLHSDIDHLKDLRYEVGSLWKGQASKLEAQFQNERMELEKHYIEEIELIKRKLERRHTLKLKEQQREYDEAITELKNDLKKLKADLYEATLNNNRYNEDLKEKLYREFQEKFYNETKAVREHNEKLNKELAKTTKEKIELARRTRELETNLENESSTIKEYASKLNHEYQIKFQKIISENEKLKAEKRLIENANEVMHSNIIRIEAEKKNLESKLCLSEKMSNDCEDSIKLLRDQNKSLSQEINTLRVEKTDVQKNIEAANEKERQTRAELKRIEEELNESTNRYIFLEREKLQQEKLVISFRREIEGNLINQKGVLSKIENYESESNRLRNLLETERNENKRLHERFQQDAELLRKKDNEIQTVKDELAALKTEYEEIRSKLEACSENLQKSNSEKASLREKIEKLKITTDLNHKQELVTVQSKYVVEFNKRLEYVKKSYEQEIEQLKSKIKCSNNKEEPPVPSTISTESSKNIINKIICGHNINQEFCNCSEAGLFNNSCFKKTESSSNNESEQMTCFDSSFEKRFSSNVKFNNDQNKPQLTSINNENIQNTIIRNKKVDDPLLFHSERCSTVNTQLSQNHEHKELSNSYQNHYLSKFTEDLGKIQTSPKFYRQLEEQHGNLSINDHSLKVYKNNRTGRSYEKTKSSFEKAEKSYDSHLIRTLLKDIQCEVHLLNKMIDESTPYSSPRHTDNQTIFKNKDHNKTNDKYIKSGTKANEIQNALRHLHSENYELHQESTPQINDTTEHESSYHELLKRRAMLEKLVDILQEKMQEKRREKKSKQEVIIKDSSNDEDSTI
ncbi:chromosome partition protein Smc isoform X4 [Hydra vulgaris]|uniref:Chromosome partition protein Smc isoform X4 n=1 Tax=Hydra vulgaris TaxID=6087 RepID=A0ABM4BCG4_HYDVU